MKLVRGFISFFVSINLVVLQFGYASTLPVKVDRSVAQKHQAILDKAKNGVQIVNIVNPNSKGLSHNKFKEYNVNPSGLILNNSKHITNTQLAGQISFNPNLVNNAKTILNEVTGTNRSILKGYTEVAGVRADVIVANPNGITINGGGFINTNKAVLTTGQLSYLNGLANGFDINSGDILIEGEGFNTSNINSVELYAKALQVNAKFYAKNLKAVIGENKIGLDGKILEDSGVAIDSSLLGGIYANRIKLVSTDNGVGVNLPSEVFTLDSLTLSENGDLINNGFISAENIDINATKVENNGAIYSTNDMVVSAKDLVNKEMIRSNNDIDLQIESNFNNNLDAVVYADGDISLSSNNSIINEGLIQSNKDINIIAKVLENKTKEAKYRTSVKSSKKRVSQGHSNSYDNVTTTISTDLIDKIYDPALILSKGNINMNVDTLNNFYSFISADNNILLNATQANNIGKILTQTTTIETDIYRNEKYFKWKWRERKKYHGTTTSSSTTRLPTPNYGIVAQNSIVGNVVNLNNINSGISQNGLYQVNKSNLIENIPTNILTNGTVDPNSSLPIGEYGLFVVNERENHPYLVETNSLYTSYDKFVSSTYLLDRIDLKPENIIKRLGDGLYETNLVKDSIIKLTGERYLDGFGSDISQFQALMDNAISLKDELKLSYGVSLSKEQIAQLNKDIVWMEQRVVNGQEVLVPIVYLATIEQKNMQDGAKIVANNSIDLNIANNTTNQGLISSNKDMVIDAGNIVNQGGTIKSGNDIDLVATNSIQNISGNIEASNNINLSAKDIDIRSYTTQKNYTQSNGYQKSTLKGATSSVIAKGDIVMEGEKSLSLVGANTRANGDILLKSTDGKVAINSLQTDDKFDFGGGDNYYRGENIKNTSSNIIGDNITILANTNLDVVASSIEAKENLNIKAKKVNITSKQDSSYFKMKTTSKGFLTKSTTTEEKYISKNVDSFLKAKNIDISSNSLDLLSSHIKANEVEITSNIINLISSEDTNYESKFTDESGIVLRTIESKGKLEQTASASTIEVSNGLIVNDEDITKHLNTNNLVKILSSEGNLSHKQINLVKATLENNQWDEKTKTLSAVAAVAIKAVVTFFTAGKATAVANLAIDTAINQAISVAVESMVSQAVVQAISSAITGNSFKLDIASITQEAVSLGVLSYANGLVQANLDLVDALYTKEFMNITDYTKNAVVKGALQGVNSEILGGEFKDGFTTGAIVSILNDTSLQMRKYIKDNYVYGKNLSAGVNNDGVKLGGSHKEFIEKTSSGELETEHIIAPFGGSQTEKGKIFGIEYEKDSLADHTVEAFAGPHDFLSSWNYENIAEETTLIADNFYINVASGLLLIPSIPFAVSPYIQNNLDKIQDYRYYLKNYNELTQKAINLHSNARRIDEIK